MVQSCPVLSAFRVASGGPPPVRGEGAGRLLSSLVFWCGVFIVIDRFEVEGLVASCHGAMSGIAASDWVSYTT